MKKLIILSTLCGAVAISASAHANNLEYMVNPTESDHKVPTKAEERSSVFSSGKEYEVTYETSAQSLNQAAPAAGPTSGEVPNDHYLGH